MDVRGDFLGPPHCTNTRTLPIKVIEKQCTGTGVIKRQIPLYQDGMELRDRKMTKDCTHSLRIGNIRALNGCAGRLFGAAKLHNHKNSANKSNRKAMHRNWSNQKANPALKTIQYQVPQ